MAPSERELQVAAVFTIENWCLVTFFDTKCPNAMWQSIIEAIDVSGDGVVRREARVTVDEFRHLALQTC
jgi:hypothetical protein